MRISHFLYFFLHKVAGNGSKTSLVIAAIWQYSVNITYDLSPLGRVLSRGKLENVSRGPLSRTRKHFEFSRRKISRALGPSPFWGHKLDLSAKTTSQLGGRKIPPVSPLSFVCEARKAESYSHTFRSFSAQKHSGK